MKRNKVLSAVLALGLGGTLFQGCGIGFLSDCAAEGTISGSAFDELTPLEQLLWEENSCGRYERR